MANTRGTKHSDKGKNPTPPTMQHPQPTKEHRNHGTYNPQGEHRATGKMC